jgi:hypothetical protein
MSFAHMSIEIVKQQQRDLMAQRADKRAQELIYLRNVIQRKRFHRTTDFVVECIFTLQLFLAGAFISALWYA